MRRLFWGSAVGLLLALLAISPLRPAPARAAAESPPLRGIIFVHGIHGDARLPGFEPLLQPLLDPTNYVFESFTYWDDVANRSSSGQCDPGPIPQSTVAGFPVDVPASGAPAFCDSEDDVGLNAILLDQEITKRTSPGPLQWPVDRITLVANSMGGAIVRAYLAYAVESANPSLASVDSVVFLQGAQEGSWLAKADQVANEALVSQIPGVRDAVMSLEQLALDQYQIDTNRPAIADLTPQSELYLFDSKAQYLPPIRYANVASDITTKVATRVWWWTVTSDLPVRLGDYVMVPGFDDPTRTDWMGGARFLPAAIGRGAASMQWVLPGEATMQLRSGADGSPYWDLTEVLNAPMSHFQLGSQLATLQDPTGASPSLDRALLDWIAGLDGAASLSPNSAARSSVPRAGRVTSTGGAPAPNIMTRGATPAAASAAHGTQTPQPKRHTAPRTEPLAFVDQRTGLVLVLPATPALGKTSTLAFQVPQRGVYQVEAKGAIQQPDPARIIVAYDGPAILSPLLGSAAATTSAHPAPVTVTVSVRAEVDPIRHFAEATLTEAGSHFHLVSRPGASDRAAALARFETASLAADFRSLHSVLSHDLLGAYSEASFAAEGARQVSQAGRITAVRRVTVGDVHVADDGIPRFRATYDAERLAPDGSMGRGRFVATFVEQNGDWRLWFMDAVL